MRLKAGRQPPERMIRVTVHAHSDHVSPDAHRLCFVRVCAAIGAGAAGFPASVDRSMLPFAMLEQLLPHRAGYTSVRMADEAMPLMAAKCTVPDITPENINVTDTVTFTWEII